ncbi:hypothetical protein GQ54DRAFT_298158 [Martensiomyces pterosporus]|nr:hypothetical protein GQ54DRAFT_298158 [Martensiomyces pterosporus]
MDPDGCAGVVAVSKCVGSRCLFVSCVASNPIDVAIKGSEIGTDVHVRLGASKCAGRSQVSLPDAAVAKAPACLAVATIMVGTRRIKLRLGGGRAMRPAASGSQPIAPQLNDAFEWQTEHKYRMRRRLSLRVRLITQLANGIGIFSSPFY